MATWESFHSRVEPHVIGCPIPTIDQALRQAAQEFFARTKLWREWLDPVTVVSGVRDYDLDPPIGAVITRMEHASVDGSVLAVGSYLMPSIAPPAAGYAADVGAVSPDRMTLTLPSGMGSGQVVSVRAVLQPSNTSAGIPDFLFAHHADDIANGTKHRLMLIPDTTFFKPDLAMNCRAMFDQAIAAKAVDSWRGHTNATPRPRVNFL